MPSHDIIDNRTTKLADQIKGLLDSSEKARFAVGYLFLSGLECIHDKLHRLSEFRLLIGNTTNKQTLEQLAELYRNLQPVKENVEAESYPRRTDIRNISAETADNLRNAVELMDQTDEGESLVATLVRMIKENKLKVRVFTKGRLHAKAYIFDYGQVYDEGSQPVNRHEKGIAVVGSSNLTLCGVTHNTELNVIVQGNDNHAELVRWFDELWDEAQDFDKALMDELNMSWALAEVRPYDIYMKTLYALLRDRLEGDDGKDVIWESEIKSRLADFQLVALEQAIQMIKDYGGCFVADVVGLGKSYIGAAIIKHFKQTYQAQTLIICPAPLVDMWKRFNVVYDLNAQVLSMGYLRETEELSDNILFKEYRNQDFVLIDESHNFRHKDTQRYKVIESFLSMGNRRCCFLTATPRNKSLSDIYNQIKLFHQEDLTNIPVDPASLREYFKLIEKGERNLPDFLSKILVRRTRKHILRWYGFDAETDLKLDPNKFEQYLNGKRAYVLVGGRKQFFPKRNLETIEYSIEDTYQGLYQRIRQYIGKSRKQGTLHFVPGELSYAKYGLWQYVDDNKQKMEPYMSLKRAGANLKGLMRVLLFKRFESSVYAFKRTIERLLKVHRLFSEALSEGIVPAGDDAQTLLYESDYDEEVRLLDELRNVSGKYRIEDFDVLRLKEHLENDIEVLEELHRLVDPITPEKDTKLQVMKARLAEMPLKKGKRLIFSQYADTAQYLYDNLNPNGDIDDMDVIYSGEKSKARAVGRFSPKSNPEYERQIGDTELNTLITTDVLAEGLNLQDCDKIINYDLHWNPVKLIQRFGRIDRIGSEYDAIYGFNFLPETGIEKNLKLKEKLRNRIQEIHDTIGEDAEILDMTEKLNEEAMYAIYEQKGRQLDLFEDDEDMLDLNEAEEILRNLRQDNPEEYERITQLRDGIRTAKPALKRGLYVFCEAGRYQQLFLLDNNGQVISRDIPKILGTISCGKELDPGKLPAKHNEAVMRVKRQFAKEVKRRETERAHTLSLRQSQRYVLKEIRILFSNAKDDDARNRLTILERAYRGPITEAINRELNHLRRNGITGQAILQALERIYLQHNMKDMVQHRSMLPQEPVVPKIICSEALV